MGDIVQFPSEADLLREMVAGLLERVTTGETTDVAFVEVRKSGETATAYAGLGNYHPLHSGAWRLALRLCAEEDD